jgi:hypothetical protein
VNVCRVNLPRFHIPCFGGWKKYIVLKPAQTLTEEWYVGWIAGQHIGVSRIPITDMVRVLIGPDDSTFFAVTQDGTQLPLQCTSEGEIGSGGLYRWVPLH